MKGIYTGWAPHMPIGIDSKPRDWIIGEGIVLEFNTIPSAIIQSRGFQSIPMGMWGAQPVLYRFHITLGTKVIMRLKAPRGFYLLFFTQLWERFGFCTLQTIIILYMTEALLLSDDRAYLLYGAFSSMLFLTPVLGGYIADRYLGFKRSIMIGGVLMTLGYLILALPGSSSMLLGLSVIIVANGLFRPTISSIVGDLYRPEDIGREGGFALFNRGMTIGSLLPPLFTGYLVNRYGYNSGFLVASLGMIIGFVTFVLGRSRLRCSCGALPPTSPLHDRGRALGFYALFILALIGCIGAAMFLFQFPGETATLLGVLSLITLCVIIHVLLKEKHAQRKMRIAISVLTLISVGFWALYNQTYTSLMLYANRNMENEFLGFAINAEFTQFFNPFFILLFSPILSGLWNALSRTKNDPSLPMKFSMGVSLMGCSFFLLGLGGVYFGQGGQISPNWLMGSYLLQTLGALILSPIGLAMMTALSPKHLLGMMTGVWFLTQSAGFAVGSGLSTLASLPLQTSLAGSLTIYNHAFFIYGAIALLLAALSFALIPYFKKSSFPTQDVKMRSSSRAGAMLKNPLKG